MRSLVKLIKKTYRMAGPRERKVVLSNVLSLSGLQAISYILPIIVLPYLFRVIGPEKFGLISFAQAFVQYFIILTDYGFGISATREISLYRHEHRRVREIFSAVMIAKIGLALISLAILSAIVYFIPRFRYDWMLYVISFGAVMGSTLFPVWFFQGTEKMKYIADLNIIGSIVYAVSILFLVKGPQDYLTVPLIQSTVSLVTGVLGMYIVFSHFGVRFEFQKYAIVRTHLKAGWDIFLSVVAINAYTTTRIFTVGLLTNNTLTGLYSIAEKIAGVVQTFPLASFSQAIFPRLSKIYHKNRPKAFKMMQQIQRITNQISTVCLPLCFLFAPWIVRMVCGGEYPATVMSLRLLLISVCFISANAFRVQFLLVAGKTDVYSRIHIMMAMMGLPLIFLFIYFYSYRGAAAATVIIEAGIFFITYFTVKRLKF